MGYVFGQFVVIIGDRRPCVTARFLAPLCPTLLGPLWVNPAEILPGKWAGVWQQMIVNLLMCIEVRGCSGWKTVKNRWFSPFLTRVDRGRGQLLGPLWADPAEILRGKQARVWLLMIGISLMCVKVQGRSGWKTDVFVVFFPDWPTLRLIARPPVGRSGQNLTW